MRTPDGKGPCGPAPSILAATLVVAPLGGLVGCGEAQYETRLQAAETADPEPFDPASQAPDRGTSPAPEPASPALAPGVDLVMQWADLELRVSSRLREMRRTLGATSAGRPASRQVVQAEIRLAAAKRHAAAGRLSRALLEAEAALVHLAEVAAARSALMSRFSDPANLELWQSLVGSTVTGAPRRQRVIVVDKLERRLDLFQGGRQVATFTAELGTNGLSVKTREGDGATPEGLYRVLAKHRGAATLYHKALLLDYPNAEDRRRFVARQASGEIPAGAGIGGLIEIHGGGGSGRDWTDGCVALSDSDMDVLYRQVDLDTQVVIVGTY